MFRQDGQRIAEAERTRSLGPSLSLYCPHQKLLAKGVGGRGQLEFSAIRPNVWLANKKRKKKSLPPLGAANLLCPPLEGSPAASPKRGSLLPKIFGMQNNCKKSLDTSELDLLKVALSNASAG